MASLKVRAFFQSAILNHSALLRRLVLRAVVESGKWRGPEETW